MNEKLTDQEIIDLLFLRFAVAHKFLNGYGDPNNFEGLKNYFAVKRKTSESRVSLIIDDVVDSILNSTKEILILMTASTIGKKRKFQHLLCARIKENVRFWPEEFFFQNIRNYNNQWLKVVDLQEEMKSGNLKRLTFTDLGVSLLHSEQSKKLRENVNKRKLLAPLAPKKDFVVTEEDIINMYKPEKQQKVTSETKTSVEKKVNRTLEGTFIEEKTTTVIKRTTFIPKVTATIDNFILKPINFHALTLKPRVQTQMITQSETLNPKPLNRFSKKRRQNTKLVSGNVGASGHVLNFINCL